MSIDIQAHDLPVAVNVDREMTTQELLNQALRIDEVLKRVMKQDIHYGVIPGTQKPTLYQAGAEKICATFRLAPRYEVEDLSDPQENFYRYRAKCSLHTIRDGLFVGSAMGEASSAEEKYQWEAAVCKEHYDSTDAGRRRIKFKKTRDNEAGFVEILQVQRNCADLANTVLKIACKRAFLSAVKGATAASDIMDVDLDEEAVADMKRSEAKEQVKPKQKAPSAPKLAFGRSKGKSIDDPSVPIEDLEWMMKYLSDGLQKPERAQYHAKDKETISSLMLEIDRRTNAAPGLNSAAPDVPDDVWKDMCATWAKSQPKDYKALKAELGIEHAGELPPEERAGFRDRMVKK